MAKRKKAQPWDAVFDRVRVVRRSPDVVYPPPTTDAELDAMESQLGSRLPHSYREFMKRFGPGCIKELVYLLPITPMGKGRAAQTLATRTEERRNIFGRMRLGPDYNNEWLSRLIYFAGHQNGNAEYAWDPTEVTQTTPHECRFYTLERLREDRPIAAGESFAEFLTWLDTDIRSWRNSDPESREPPGIAFWQTAVRNKKSPSKRDVKVWLTFNNNTARDLARSIRDRGQKDAFPILADALQEAGCTNADLLDSCRTGDPDIDGAWVLRVLLGKRKHP